MMIVGKCAPLSSGAAFDQSFLWAPQPCLLSLQRDGHC